MKSVLCDTSSLILLYRCGAAGHLCGLYSAVISMSVKMELTMHGYEGSLYFRDLCENRIISVAELQDMSCCRVPGIHPGERDIIQLYNRGSGDFILIDDGRAAAYCREKSIPYINALLALKIICKCGRIDRKSYFLSEEKLLQHARYTSAVKAWADSAGEAELEFFMP